MNPRVLEEIRQRHAAAGYLAEQLPEVIKDWEDGEPMDDSDLMRGLRSSYGSRWGYSTDGITFALHAHRDMAQLLAYIEELEKR